MSWLVEPFQWPFMQTALLGAALIGVTCATLGVYVVLRGMAFIGDALAHTTLPGLVIASLAGAHLSVGALVTAVVAALGIGWVSRRGAVREDTAIGVLFTGMFAFGIVLASQTRTFRNLTELLFGNILAVTVQDLVLIAAVALLVVLALALFHKELELTSVDPLYADSIGLHPDVIRYGLLGLLALTVVTAIQAVGVVLTEALLVTPAAAASLLTNRLSRMMLIAVAISVLSALAGLYASYYLKVSSGAAIVLTCTFCFGLAMALRAARRRRG